MNVSSSFSLNSSARPSLGFACLIECASVELSLLNLSLSLSVEC